MSLSYGLSTIAHGELKNYKHKSLSKSLLRYKVKSVHSIHWNRNRKEAPLCTAHSASYTIEASVVLPVTICLIVFILFFLRMFQVESGIQKVLDQTSRQVAAISKNAEKINCRDVILLCNARIMAEKIPTSYIKGNVIGIDYSDSCMDDNYVSLVAAYEIEFPIKMFGNLCWNVTQQSVNRKWIGWDPKEGMEDEAYVYVTETGEVFHRQLKCVYLHPSIHAINKTELKGKRNEEGRKYTQCRLCKKRKLSQNTVYVTSYGKAYHNSLGCSGLKRTIYRKKIEEVHNMRPCSKCSKDEGL